MATPTPINLNQMLVAGLTPPGPSGPGNKMVSFQASFVAGNQSYVADLGLLISNGSFTSPSTMFIDNGNNPNSLNVQIPSTGQTFEAPPFSNGYYTLAEGKNAGQIVLSSVGGATTAAVVVVFNYFLPPVVWLITQAGAGAAVTIADGADVTQGSKADAAVTNPASSASVIALLKGLLTELITIANNSKPAITWTTTVVVLPAATSTTLLAANANRKALRVQNVGAANPFTMVFGAGPAVVGQGLQYSPAPGAGYGGGADAYGPNEVSTQAVQAISTVGTTVLVMEGQ